jgi:S-ribosylhomocysteine lyase LuxS involved in autoinducer biosynthesis
MGRIEIKDARRTVDGKKINAFRVRTIGENNEILQTSEILNTTEAVKKHIRAMALAWDSNGECEVVDSTYRGKFDGKLIELDQYDKLNYGLIS